MPKKLQTIYGGTWLLTVLMLLIDWIWASRIGFRVESKSAMHTMRIILGVFAISGLILIISRITYKDIARKLFYRNAAHSFMWVTVLVTFTHVCAVFQYLCVTTDFPLVNNSLISVDYALGFHWPDIYRWIKTHHLVRSALDLAYASGAYQLLAIPVILAITLNSQDYAEFVVQFIVSATLVILISVPFPAESAFVHFGVHDPNTVSTVSDFSLFRNGSTRELAFTSVQGLVSFPSFHTILALCLAYSLRHVRFVFPIGIAMNLLMILSTPTQGGHYLSDVLAGLIAGVLVIYFVRWVILRSPPWLSNRPTTTQVV
ncbi:phosphatase PAP2 family protein [Paraburkholderia sediminicola]|uniref:phosphatase PAP2 family protein n=1 Tax=Paraburkholderia sediminicola TaxID=458836 RepID=UPI0038BC4E29